MHRIAQGEEAALRELYEGYSARLMGLLTALLRDRQRAEDVLQQVFLQAWRTARTYDPRRGTPVAWLTQIARSRALDALRRLRPEAPTPSVDAATAESDELASLPERIDVQSALSRLPPAERRLIELSYLGGYSHAELAAALGLPLGTVKSTLRRGIERLRSLVREEDGHVGDRAPAR